LKNNCNKTEPVRLHSCGFDVYCIWDELEKLPLHGLTDRETNGCNMPAEPAALATFVRSTRLPIN